ncbi:MAG: DUF2339 domain-containing protein [Desulfuromonadaceae bacterium]
MYVLAALIGLIGGAWLVTELGKEIAGAIFGALLGISWIRQQRLHSRLEQLERSATARQGKASPQPTEKPASIGPKTATDDFIFEPAVPPPQKNAFGIPKTAAEAEKPAPPKPAAQIKQPQPPTAGKSPQVELWNIFVSYFTGGNLVVRAGVVVLFFGVAFLLKYSAERNIVPIELRLLGVSLGAIGLLAFGFRLRHKRTGYSLILQGAAVGILFLTIFAALRLYHLLPAGLALSLLVGLSIFSALLAILQDARVLAVLGTVGGFLAPVLTSTGGGSHVQLFSYYALLNLGILVITWYRSWRELNLLGFVFTFGIGTLWGARSYHPELFASTEPFLLLFFLFYLANGILFARNLPLPHKGFIDGTLVFGTPIVCFGLQAVLVKPYPYGLAWSALAMGLLYAILARVLLQRGSSAMRTLVESFMSTGVVFATVAIPLALDGRWTAAVVWIALKQNRWMPRIFGLVLQLLAGFAFLRDLHQPADALPICNGLFFGGCCLALAGFFSGYRLHRQGQQLVAAELESNLALGWGAIWWLVISLHEIETFAPHLLQLSWALALASLSALTAFLVGRKLSWDNLKRLYFLLLPAMAIGAFFSLLEFHHRPSIHGGWLVWPLAFAIYYLLLHRDETSESGTYLKYQHWGLLQRGSSAMRTLVESFMSTGVVFATVAIPLALDGRWTAAALCRLWNSFLWPIRSFQSSYLNSGLIPAICYLWLGSLAANLLSTGNPRPLPYLPLLNPLDLTQALVLLAIGYWMLVLTNKLQIRPLGLERHNRIILLGGTIFFWLNAVLIRTLHFWAGVRFSPHALFRSDLVQTSLSIFWTLSALLIMLYGARKPMRSSWLVGAGLIGVVILKLFIVDLANTSTVERIISFIGVGLLCLLVGYLAPLPPRSSDAQEAS